MIYDYVLVNKRTPSWIEDGGYYKDPDNNKFIGYSSVSESSIPDTATKYSKSEMITKVLDIHSRYPISVVESDDAVTALTDSEVTSQVNAWCSARGL